MNEPTFITTIIPYGFIGTGIIFLFTSIQLIVKTNRLRKIGKTTTGKVISIHTLGYSKSNHPSSYRIVEFRDSKGKKYTIEGKLGNILWSLTPQINQKLRVLYDPNKPTEAIIATFAELHLPYLMTITLGIVLFIMGLLAALILLNC